MIRFSILLTVHGDKLEGLLDVLCISFCKVVANLQTALVSFAILSIVFITESASLFLRLTFSLLPSLRIHVIIYRPGPRLRGAVYRYYRYQYQEGRSFHRSVVSAYE